MAEWGYYSDPEMEYAAWLDHRAEQAALDYEMGSIPPPSRLPEGLPWKCSVEGCKSTARWSYNDRRYCIAHGEEVPEIAVYLDPPVKEDEHEQG